ncbi:MAG: YdbL family protein [Desulfuromusa sp.]|nr:YdbL family protein [Desulfuromusa sp.]
MKTITRSLGLLLALSVISCVTINIYFPAEEIRGAADKIVNEVWGDSPKNGAEEMVPQPQKKSPGSSFYDLLRPTNAIAAQNIDVSTPAIRAIKKSIKTRSAALISFLNTGTVGLSFDGLLKVRSTGGLSLKQKAQVNKLVKAENQDRMRLYKEIAVANDFPDKAGEVQNIFADSWRKQAQKGWYLEKNDGSWGQK